MQLGQMMIRNILIVRLGLGKKTPDFCWNRESRPLQKLWTENTGFLTDGIFLTSPNLK